MPGRETDETSAARRQLRRAVAERLKSAAHPHGRFRLDPPMRRSILLLATLAALLLEPGTAMAYIDPNAGGLLFQLLAPVFAAAVGAWLVLRRWIVAAARRFWLRLTGRETE